MRPFLILISILSLPCLGFAQSNLKISGQVVDSHTGQSLEGANVFVLNKETRKYIDYSVSNRKGAFEVGNLPENVVLEVLVSFGGYRDTSTTITLSRQTKLFNTGIWKLDTAIKEMQGVTVTALKPPFVVKHDTLEFNASAFKSLPNDVVQDLLRKLPGVQIDGDGNVTVNGKKVDKIKVDGREFYSGNLKVALENLPVSVIDKVQVIDTRDQGTEHNSIIAPTADKVTLNLTFKEDKKRGVMGNVSAGYGTDDRYDANGFVDMLHGKERVSLIGNTSNINPMGFIVAGGGSVGGGLGALMGRAAGVLKNSSFLGTSLNEDWGRPGKLDVNYFYTSQDLPTETTTSQTNLLPDSSFLYNSHSLNSSKSSNHMLQGNYDWLAVDSLQKLFVVTSLNFGNNSYSTSMSASSTTTSGGLINSQNNYNYSQEKSFSLSNHISYEWGSRNRNTNLNVNWNFSLQHQNGTRANQSANIFYTPTYQADSINQQGYDRSNGLNNTVSLNLYQKFSPKLTGILNYTLQQSFNTAYLNIYDYDSLSHGYDQLDSLYSNNNHNESWNHLFSAALGYHINKLSIEPGIGYRIIDQQDRLVWKDSTISISQHYFSPRLAASYQINKRSTWDIHYSAESTTPTIDQLSPVQNNTNPLSIKEGNPYLRSSINQSIFTDVRYFSMDSKWHAYLRGSASFVSNQIVNDTYYDSLGRQISSYTNVNGVRNFSMMAGGGRQLKFHSWNFAIDLNPTFSNSRSVSLVNRELNVGNTVSFAPTVGLNLQYLEKIILSVSGSVQYNSTQYSLPGIADVKYQVETLDGYFRIAPVKRFSIYSNIYYMFNGQLPADFQRSSTLVNLGANYDLLKSRLLTIGISVNDLLNQNTNVTRTVTPTAISNTQTATLRRYGLLTARYRFNHFNGPRKPVNKPS